MTCFQFNQLEPKAQLQYIYDRCQLLDFMMQSDKGSPDAVCLYHDGNVFMEVRFDGLQGDRVKEIRSYPCIQQLSHWYNQINISAFFQNVSRN